MQFIWIFIAGFVLYLFSFIVSSDLVNNRHDELMMCKRRAINVNVQLCL